MQASSSKKNIMSWFVFSSAIFIVCGGVGYMYWSRLSASFAQTQQQKKSIEESIKALEADIDQRKHYPDKKKEYERHVEKLSCYAAHDAKKFIATALTDVAHVVPPTVFLSELSIAKSIHVGGYAHTIQAVLDLLTNLSQLPYILHGKIVQLKTAETAEKPFIEFLIKLDIKSCKESYGNY